MLQRPKVLLLSDKFPEKAINLLRTRCDLEVCKSNTGCVSTSIHDIVNCIPGKFGIFCFSSIPINEEILKAASPSLKVVSTMSVGYDHVDLASMKKFGVRLGNTPGVLTEAVAELAVGLIIATTRRFIEGNHMVKTGKWKEWSPNWMCGRGIRNSVVGIIGCGKIGTSIAEKLNVFKVAKILYTSRREKSELKAIGGQLTTVDKLMESSDFVVVSAALNEETKFIVNKNRIALMKPNAILVNIGRGGCSLYILSGNMPLPDGRQFTKYGLDSLIDQDALIEALQEKRIRGAGLDVMSPEPLPIDHPLLGLDNVFLLPHVGSSTYETEDEMAMMTAKNILAVLDDAPMPSEVCC